MKHIIGGYQIDLRTRSTAQLEEMVELATERLERAEEELDSLQGELIRRRPCATTNRHLRSVR